MNNTFMANNACTPEQKILFETPPISRLSLGKAPFSTRKFSFPAALNANLLGLPTSGITENSKESTTAKRRFSNVGDVVSRKLSSTIGWRSTNVLPEEVISQGRMLFGQYVKHRLKRSGIFNKKLSLLRLRSVIGITNCGVTVREVIPFLMAAGLELERMYPKLYSSISRQSSMSPGGVLISEKTAAGLLAAISHELLKVDITWGKVISVFAVAGGLAVDCVCQGHPEYLHGLMDGMTEVLEDDLAEWVAANGGWTALCSQCKCPETELSTVEYASIIALIVTAIFLAYFMVRCFIRLEYF